MKVIITESQMNNTIEKLIKRVNKDVVSVNFDVKKQAVIDDKGKGMSYYDKTIITVVLDPHNILGGNIHHVVSTLYYPLRKEIQKALKGFMNIDTTKYMSPYEVEYHVLGTTRV
jgi:CRISPR/Cas system-associated endonuclease Cas3-HD